MEMKMDDNETLFLYGSGRDRDTRTQRRGNFPRETATRVGPWIVRPSRKVAVRRADLAKHVNELITKVTSGVVQLQVRDGSAVPLQDIPALFDGIVDYETMSEGELHSLLRGEKPTVGALRAYMKKLPVADRRAAGTAMGDALHHLSKSDRAGLEKLARELEDEDRAFHDKKYEEEQTAAEAEAKKAEEARAAKWLEDKAAAEKAKAEEAAKPDTLPAPPAKDDADQMDFSQKAPEEAAVDATKHEVILDAAKVDLGSATSSEPVAVTETVKEQLADVVTAMESTAPATPPVEETPADEVSTETSEEAAAVDAEAVTGRELPEGWRTLSNTKLMELITEKGVTMPEKKNKAELTKTLETWLTGGS